MQTFPPPVSYSDSNFITSDVVAALESPFAAAAAAADEWNRESSNSSVIKAQSSQLSRKNSKIVRGRNKRMRAHQNQQRDSNFDDDQADTANSYTKEDKNQYKWLFEKIVRGGNKRMRAHQNQQRDSNFDDDQTDTANSYTKEDKNQYKWLSEKIVRGGNKRLRAHQNQQRDSNFDDDQTDTANSYTKDDKNQYKWLFEKELSRNSDLSTRLLLGKGLVFEKFIPCLDEVCAKACQTRSGIHFKVWDVDTNSQHIMVMTKWFAGYYSIEGSWKRDFVDRRKLKIRDKIKVGLDQINSRFCFSVVRGRSQG